MKNQFTLAVIALIAVALTGCGIIGGAGRDVSSVGHVVTKSANAVHRSMSY